MTQPAAPRAGRQEWCGLAVLVLPLLLVSMDVSVLYFAVPFISADLEPSATEQLWIFDIYGFVLAGLLLTMGALGDRIGRRRLLLIGAVGFSAASVVAAYSTSAEMLITARALLGVAGATLMPSTLALIRSMFLDDQQRAKAIAVWSAVMTGGVALGPVLSGVLLEHFWWGSVFLINVPAMALLMIAGPLLLPEFTGSGRIRFDLVGSALSLAAVLPIIWGIKEIAADGLRAGYVLAIVAGVGVGWLFLTRQRRQGDDAMLDLSLFRRPGFSSSMIANAVATFALVGNAVFLTQYLQSVLGQSPLVAALWSLAPSVAVGAAAPAAVAIAARVGRAAVMAGGFVVAAAGFGVMNQVTVQSPLALALVCAGVLAVGLVAVMTLVTDLAMATISPERAGAASAVLETGSEFGGALGIAVLGSVGAAVYTSRMADALPAGVPLEAAQAAQSTLGGAISAAGHLPSELGAAVLGVARVAFTSGMSAAAVVGAVVMLAAAVLCGTTLRSSVAKVTEPVGDSEPLPLP